MTAPVTINYTLIWNGLGGRLNAPVVFKTPVTGHAATIKQYLTVNERKAWIHCELRKDGTLTAFADMQWDFGSGPAIDTPSVVLASLAHDCICHLTNLRLIPWSFRAVGDKFYRWLLKQYGVGLGRRWWHWLCVYSYSQGIARWRDKL